MLPNSNTVYYAKVKRDIRSKTNYTRSPVTLFYLGSGDSTETYCSWYYTPLPCYSTLLIKVFFFALPFRLLFWGCIWLSPLRFSVALETGAIGKTQYRLSLCKLNFQTAKNKSKQDNRGETAVALHLSRKKRQQNVLWSCVNLMKSTLDIETKVPRTVYRVFDNTLSPASLCCPIHNSDTIRFFSMDKDSLFPLAILGYHIDCCFHAWSVYVN